MPTNIFISFDYNDRDEANGFRSISSNTNHDLSFHDWSLQNPVTSQRGKPLTFLPNDERSKPIREEIKKKLDKASKLVVLIGEDTYSSKWVEWEIYTFYEKKKNVSGDNTSKRICGMKLKGIDNVTIPRALQRRSATILPWNLDKLETWLDRKV